MQKRTLLAIAAAAVTAIASPSVSRAQDPQPQPPPQPQPMPQPQPPTDTARGEVALEPSFNSLIAALDNTTAQIAKLKALTSVSAENVQLVNVDDVAKDKSDSLNTVMKAHESDVAALRSAIAENTAITDVLSKSSPALTPNDIVATDVRSDGKVIMYYWKKQ